MSQALHTSSTGINAGQAQINVIAHNVANINTVAYKSANMTFQTLYSHNLSHGSAATKDGGGTNPKQIGLGVKIGGITRNFAPGSFVSTGRSLDTMISGNGFFVVQDADGKLYFTRDGVFNVDSQGNLVTQNGLKVVGAKSVYSNASSGTTVKIPSHMIAKVEGDSKVGDKALKDLNNASITTGTVVIKKGDHMVELPVGDGNTTVSDMIEAFNKAISDYETAHGTEDDPLDLGISFDVNADGTISYTGEVDEFPAEGTTSNFCGETGLGKNKHQSYELSQTVKLQEMTNYNDTNAVTLTDTAIDENGILIASYTNGSVLTQYVDDAQTLQWRYITPEGIVITGEDVKAEGTAIKESNFAIELATMVNPEGLLSLNNNLWEWGPDVGEIYYGIAGEVAFGPIESGGYEESNVDIATELSNMISAQRMIQMNSRVFSTASSVMEILSYLGQ